MIIEDLKIEIYDGRYNKREIEEKIKEVIEKGWFPYLMSGNLSDGLVVMFIRI